MNDLILKTNWQINNQNIFYIKKGDSEYNRIYNFWVKTGKKKIDLILSQKGLYRFYSECRTEQRFIFHDGIELKYKEPDTLGMFIDVSAIYVENGDSDATIMLAFDDPEAEEGVNQTKYNEQEFLSTFGTFANFKACFKGFKIIKKEINL